MDSTPKPQPPENPKKPRVGRKDQRRDEAAMERLFKALEAGNTFGNACTLAGIGARTFYRWKAEGETAKEGTFARQFWQKVKDAEAQAIHRNVLVIQTAAKKSWQAAAWWLERKYPEDWARHERITSEVSGKGGAPIQSQVVAAIVSTDDDMSEGACDALLDRYFTRKSNGTRTESEGGDSNAAGAKPDAGTPEASAST